MAERIVEDHFDRAKKFCERVLALVKKGAYCDVTVKMEDGRITIWTETMKHKP